MSISTIMTFSLIFGIAFSVLLFVLIVPEKKRKKLNNFGKFLHDLCNFKFLLVEKILKFFYVFSTVFIILAGFFMLFMTTKHITYNGYWVEPTYETEWVGYYGIIVLLVGPILIRFLYEFIMIAILQVTNIISINKKLDKIANVAPTDENAVTESDQEETTTINFCASCGSRLDENNRCTYCNKQY